MTVITRKSLVASLVIAVLLVIGGVSRLLPGPEGSASWFNALIATAWADSDDDDDEDGFLGSDPLAKAGFDRTVAAGATVVLDGSGSVSPAGTLLAYAWSFADKPAGSVALIDDPAAVKPSFVADLAGDYLVELVVTAGALSSPADSVTVSTANVPPHADAGPDRLAALADLAVLDGSGSSDFDGDALSYSWTLLETPIGSAAALSDPSALRPTFFVDLSGDYVAELVVDDGGAASPPSRVTLSTGNLAPEPDAGPDISAAVGNKVRVDSDGTSDADGDRLQARWKLIARPPASTATLSTPEGGRPRITLDDPGVYVIQLRSKDETAKAFDSVTISTDNTIPVANAGPDQEIAIDQEVTLDGGASSDVDGDLLSYRWALVSVPAGSNAVLDDGAAIRPSFTADLAGDYVAQLIVDDGTEPSRADTVLLSTGNLAPVADAGPDQTVTGNTAQLDGSGSSDANGDPLTFRWSALSMAGDDDDDDDLGSGFSDPAAAAPTLTLAGDDNDDDGGSGLSLVQLFVNDGATDSEADTLLISKANSRPVADAGADERVLRDQPITLDGSSSSDADNDALTFQWALIAKPEGSAASLTAAATATPSFTPDLAGLYVAQLVVADAKLASRPDTVVIQANAQPIADAGADQTVDVGTLVTLDGSASSDSDGDPLTFAWTIAAAPAGSLSVLSDPAAVVPSFTPDVGGDYLVELVVNDGFEDSAPDTVTVTAEQVVAVNLPPVLEPIGDQSVNLGSTLSLTLEASDPNGDTLAFMATPLPLPDGASLNGATGAFSFTPNAAQVGDIALTFIVSDGVLTDQESIVVTVVGAPTGGGTALSGRLLDANDFANSIETPVVGATISLLGDPATATTDANGDFLLTGVPAGSQIFDIDSSTANLAPDGSTYAGFREALELIADVTNQVDRPFFLPRIEDGSLTPVDPTVTTIVENTRLGVILEIAPFSAKNPDGTDFTGQISISEVPRGLAPAELPDFLDPGLLITIQPVGVVFDPPAAITFPNIDEVPPGEIVQVWSLDPDRGVFDIVGISEATADGASTVTVAGGIRRADWHAPLPPGSGGDSSDDENEDKDKCCEQSTGSDTALGSGGLTVTHDLVGYRSFGQERSLRLTYDSLTADPRPVIVSDTFISQRAAVAPTYSTSLKVAGIDQGEELFTDSSGLPESPSQTLRQGVQFDAAEFETGVYVYTLRKTSNYVSSALSSLQAGRVLVNNQRNSPFGAGWGLEGLSQILPQGNEAILRRGDGSISRFQGFLLNQQPEGLEFPYVSEQGFDSEQTVTPAADFNGDGITDFVTTFAADSGLPDFTGLQNLEIFLGDGEGGFLSQRIVQTNDTPFPCDDGCFFDARSLAAGDLDNDGFTDLAVPNSGLGQQLRILPGLSAGFFGTPIDIPFAGIGNHIVVADFNLDGDRDVAVSSGTSSNPVVSILFGDGTGNLPTRVDFAGLASSFITEMFSADLNGDDAPDLVLGQLVSQGGRRQIVVALNDGQGNLSPLTGPFTGIIQEEVIAPGDLDGDGDLDLIALGTVSPAALQYYWNDGTGVFERDLPNRPNQAVIQDGTLPGTSFNFDLADTADVDGDGDLDVLVTYFPSFGEDRRILVFLNDGIGLFLDRLDVQSDFRSFHEISLTDIDGDGLIDVFARGLQNGPFINKVTTFLLSSLAAAQSGGSGTFAAPAGDFSSLVRQDGGSFSRRMPDGMVINFDAQGRQTSKVDRNGNTTSYSYDIEGRVETITDPAGLSTTLSYSGGRLASIANPAGRSTLLEHDGAGNLTKIIDPDGSIREFAYDERGRLISQRSKRGFLTNYEYNFAGRNVGVDRPEGSTRRISPGRLVGVIDTSSGAGGVGNPVAFERPENALARFTDGNGNETRFALDRFGAVTRRIDAVGRIDTSERDQDGNVVRQIAANGAVTERAYDVRGNVQSVRSAIGDAAENQIRFAHEANFNQIETIIDPNSNLPVTLSYDASGNLEEIADSSGTITTRSYGDPNCPGLPTSDTFAATTPSSATVGFVYDPVTCNAVEAADPLNNVTSIAHDSAGNVVEITDAQLRTRRFEYDAMNRVVKIVDPTNVDPDPQCATSGTTCNEYDAAGNLIAVTDGNGNTTTFEYDEADRLVRRTDPLMNSKVFEYDDQGNLRFMTDGKSQVIELRYDEVNRVIAQVMMPGTPEEVVRRFEYDAANNLTLIEDPDSRLVFSYDQLNRRSEVSTAGAPFQPEVDITYSYDANGNRLSMTGLTGLLDTTYDYDELDRLIGITDPSSQGAGPAITFDYDALSRLTNRQYPNTTASDLSYDASGNLQTIAYTIGAATLSSFTYSYDDTNNRDTLDQQRSSLTVNPLLTYEYDDLDRVISATSPLPGEPSETFDYDPLGNRLSAGSQTTENVIGVGNQLLEDGSFCYSYDANGNLETKTEKVAGDCIGGVTLYSYDVENRLTRIDFAGGGFAEYRYDGLNRRIGKNVNGSEVRYIYDEEDIVLEYDELNVLQARYTHGLGIDEPLILDRDLDGSGSFGATERFIYHTDALGSITELTDSSGAIVQSYVYDSFGRIVETTGTLANPYTYTGREFDPESGFYYYRARYYDASSGRFTSGDPIGFSGGINPYLYAEANPVNLLDPTGLAPSFGECLAGCAGEQLGFGSAAAAAAAASGAPVVSKPRTSLGGPGVSGKSSPISTFLSRVLNVNVGTSIPAPTLKNPLARTANLGRILGRWIPGIGWGILAYDAIQIGLCVNDCLNEDCGNSG